MRVAVLGSGVIGVTSAWYLAEAGHEVVVVDRQPGPAMETSFANAGEISPGYSSPWAAPGIPMKAAKWLFMKHAPLILRPGVDVAMLGWLIAMLGNCTAERYKVNKGRMVRLASFSRERLIELRTTTGIQYDERSRGTLQLFRESRQLDGGALRREPSSARNRQVACGVGRDSVLDAAPCYACPKSSCPSTILRKH